MVISSPRTECSAQRRGCLEALTSVLQLLSPVYEVAGVIAEPPLSDEEIVRSELVEPSARDCAQRVCVVLVEQS
jgi:hypothetical protein